jgi:hypothetical protein
MEPQHDAVLVANFINIVPIRVNIDYRGIFFN